MGAEGSKLASVALLGRCCKVATAVRLQMPALANLKFSATADAAVRSEL
jgi:hypothetical protein